MAMEEAHTKKNYKLRWERVQVKDALKSTAVKYRKTFGRDLHTAVRRAILKNG